MSINNTSTTRVTYRALEDKPRVIITLDDFSLSSFEKMLKYSFDELIQCRGSGKFEINREMEIYRVIHGNLDIMRPTLMTKNTEFGFRLVLEAPVIDSFDEEGHDKKIREKHQLMFRVSPPASLERMLRLQVLKTSDVILMPAGDLKVGTIDKLPPTDALKRVWLDKLRKLNFGIKSNLKQLEIQTLDRTFKFCNYGSFCRWSDQSPEDAAETEAILRAALEGVVDPTLQKVSEEYEEAVHKQQTEKHRSAEAREWIRNNPDETSVTMTDPWGQTHAGASLTHQSVSAFNAGSAQATSTPFGEAGTPLIPGPKPKPRRILGDKVNKINRQQVAAGLAEVLHQQRQADQPARTDTDGDIEVEQEVVNTNTDPAYQGLIELMSSVQEELRLSRLENENLRRRERNRSGVSRAPGSERSEASRDQQGFIDDELDPSQLIVAPGQLYPPPPGTLYPPMAPEKSSAPLMDFRGAESWPPLPPVFLQTGITRQRPGTAGGAATGGTVPAVAAPADNRLVTPAMIENSMPAKAEEN